MAQTPAKARPSIDGYRHGRVPRELREQQLLDVAEEAFTELGFDGTSIEEVSRRSGIKRPLFYTYFGGKDGLYLACYRRARAAMNEQLGAAAASVDPSTPNAAHTMIQRIVRAYFAFLATSQRRWDMLYGPGVAAAGPIADEVTRLRFETVQLLAETFTAYAKPSLDAHTILGFAHATSGLGEQLGRWWRTTPDLTIDQLTELATQYIWAALSPAIAAAPVPAPDGS